MSSEQKKFYLTTPIYYVNARPHIGHAYTTIVADVLARRHRLLGDDTFFLTGTDEHGQKIERSASAAGIPPQQFADKVSAEFKSLWDRMGLTYDDYIRTTEPRHAAGVQKLFTALFERGYIYLDSYTGSYCVSDEAFVDAPAGTPCPDCGRLLETVTEENFFFKLSAFQQPLIDLIENDTLAITPESRKNEVLSFVRGGLKDLSISRSSFTWGIPVPEPAASLAKQKHVIYVWLDALTNYMTAIGYGSDDPKDIAEFERYWPADLHLVGKEIIRFHCVYWPAFLLAAGLPLPKAITAHGWLLFDNAKMS
jgi:methionyl-tRNA synthetase